MMDGTNHGVTPAVPMVSHTICSTVHILGCIRVCGQAFLFRIWSRIVCLQSFIARLIYYGIADCCPHSPKVFVRDVSGLDTRFFFCFKKTYLHFSFVCFLPAEDAWLWQENASHSASKQCVRASVHMHVHTKEISSLGTFSTGPRRLFSSQAHCRLFSLHWLDAIVRDCNASQPLCAPVSVFLTGFSLSNICRKV